MLPCENSIHSHNFHKVFAFHVCILPVCFLVILFFILPDRFVYQIEQGDPFSSFFQYFTRRIKEEIRHYEEQDKNIDSRDHNVVDPLRVKIY